MPEFSFGGVPATETSTAGPEPAGVRALAEALMARHGLDGWTFRFDRALVRAGQCDYKNKEITLSPTLMALWTPAQQQDTILHEIAHALTPKDKGHGPEWQLMCIRIGADPSRTWGHNGEQHAPPKYIGTCPYGHTVGRQKRPPSGPHSARSCTQCSKRFDTRYLFTWRPANEGDSSAQ